MVLTPPSPPPPTHHASVPELRTALGKFLAVALPPVMERLAIGTPRNEVERGLGDILRTFRLVSSLPAFSSAQWQVVVLVLLKALSMGRGPGLRPWFESREGIRRVNKELALHSFTIEEFSALLELLLVEDE